MTLPRVTVFLALSLDGRLAGPGDDLTWLDRYAGDTPEATGYEALMASADTLLLGRRTYDTVLCFGAWPFAGHRVRVLTHRPVESRHGERACAGELRCVLAALGDEGAQHVYLDGGHAARQGLEAGLVTDLWLHWVPEVLGDGPRLFDGTLTPSRWRLQTSRTLPSGLLQVHYMPSER